MSYDIFISYRRDGGDTLAQLIYDRLTNKGYRVFLDIESLRSGKFNTKLFSVIDECQDVIVILPPGALDRCQNKNDWVTLEISHALQQEKNIIPVIMRGFEWPETLPEELENLPNFNGIRDSKDYFDAAIDRLTSLLLCKPHIVNMAKKNSMKTLIPALALLIVAGICIIHYYDISSKRLSETTTPDTNGVVSNTEATYRPDSDAYNEKTGHHYAVYNYSALGLKNEFNSWEKFCESQGGYLAVINDADENEFIYNFLKENDLILAFFGYTDQDEEENWTWVNGKTSSYTNWAPGQPNNGENTNAKSGENYAQFYKKTADGRWNDSKIGVNSHRFICEWDN